MESDRVEMSVGGGLVNGHHVSNGAVGDGSAKLPKAKMDGAQMAHTNGIKQNEDTLDAGQLLQDAAPELLQMISTEFYLPMSTLVNRSAQVCWNDLSRLVEKLAKITVPSLNGPVAMPGMPENNQTKNNLDKKDAFLNFANDHKAVFIKLLVLLQWSKRGEDVRKTIELNYWLVQRRAAYGNATMMLGQMLQDLASAQVPNPDLYTAAEVLAAGKVAKLPSYGYIQPPALSPKQMIRTLRRLDNILCTKLALDVDVPAELHDFRIHDGRVTFIVANEFELDLSLMDTGAQARFLMVDLRFVFNPTPAIPDMLHDELSLITNSAIEKAGLLGAYEFVHDLTLSYKLNALHKQARDLAEGLWAGHLRIELIRRTLIVQYWSKRPGAKNWLEIGIYSGKDVGSSGPRATGVPQIRLRWNREGKYVEEHDIIMNLTQLSFEELLQQAISQHINHMLGSIYDKLACSPLYADGELQLSQSSSMNEPSQCMLEIQLSNSDNLHASIESVTGAVILGPVTDRINRVQLELCRAKQVIDEFVSKILSLRCASAESTMLRTILNSGWEHLRGFKLSHVDLGNLFGHAISRANFFRQRHWTNTWMLAVTTSVTGDYWWLIQQLSPSFTSKSRFCEVLKSRPLHMEGFLSPSYMERLADYTSGIIMLQSNAQVLAQERITYKLPEIPSFAIDARLPALSFVLDANSATPLSDVTTLFDRRTGADRPSMVDMRYHGIEQNSKYIVMVARARLSADALVLAELAATQLDASVTILPKRRQVMIRSTSEAGVPAIAEVVSKVKHLDSIVACAAAVKRSLHHKLESLSLSSLTILYNLDPSKQFKLVINFASSTHDLETRFLPYDSNPHQYMNTYITEMLTRSGRSLSKSLEEVLALLKMTQPLMSYLHHLQTETQAVHNSDTVRVHVITRQAAMYAIHYFASTEHFVHDIFDSDISDSETPKKLLVRLEILPMRRGAQNMWILRPAIEEFASYTRPSYTSNSLRSKIRLDIFSRDPTPDWLPLDEGAACDVVHPERLLSVLHRSILQWLQEALKPENPSVQVNGDIHSRGVDGATDVKPQTKQRTGNGQKPQPVQTRPNGISMQGHRSNQNFGNSKSQPKLKQEVIMLDDD